MQQFLHQQPQHMYQPHHLMVGIPIQFGINVIPGSPRSQSYYSRPMGQPGSPGFSLTPATPFNIPLSQLGCSIIPLVNSNCSSPQHNNYVRQIGQPSTDVNLENYQDSVIEYCHNNKKGQKSEKQINDNDQKSESVILIENPGLTSFERQTRSKRRNEKKTEQKTVQKQLKTQEELFSATSLGERLNKASKAAAFDIDSPVLPIRQSVRCKERESTNKKDDFSLCQIISKQNFEKSLPSKHKNNTQEIKQHIKPLSSKEPNKGEANITAVLAQKSVYLDKSLKLSTVSSRSSSRRCGAVEISKVDSQQKKVIDISRRPSLKPNSVSKQSSHQIVIELTNDSSPQEKLIEGSQSSIQSGKRERKQNPLYHNSDFLSAGKAIQQSRIGVKRSNPIEIICLAMKKPQTSRVYPQKSMDDFSLVEVTAHKNYFEASNVRKMRPKFIASGDKEKPSESINTYSLETFILTNFRKAQEIKKLNDPFQVFFPKNPNQTFIEDIFEEDTILLVDNNNQNVEVKVQRTPQDKQHTRKGKDIKDEDPLASIVNRFDFQNRAKFFSAINFIRDYKTGYAPIDIQNQQEQELAEMEVNEEPTHKQHFIRRKQAQNISLKRSCGVSYVKQPESKQQNVNDIYERLPQLVFQCSNGIPKLTEYETLYAKLFNKIFVSASSWLLCTYFESEDETLMRDYLLYPEQRWSLCKGKYFLMRSINDLWPLFIEKQFLCIHLFFDNKQLIRAPILKDFSIDEVQHIIQYSNIHLGLLFKKSINGKKSFKKSLGDAFLGDLSSAKSTEPKQRKKKSVKKEVFEPTLQQQESQQITLNSGDDKQSTAIECELVNILIVTNNETKHTASANIIDDFINDNEIQLNVTKQSPTSKSISSRKNSLIQTPPSTQNANEIDIINNQMEIEQATCQTPQIENQNCLNSKYSSLVCSPNMPSALEQITATEAIVIQRRDENANGLHSLEQKNNYFDLVNNSLEKSNQQVHNQYCDTQSTNNPDNVNFIQATSSSHSEIQPFEKECAQTGQNQCNKSSLICQEIIDYIDRDISSKNINTLSAKAELYVEERGWKQSSALIKSLLSTFILYAKDEFEKLALEMMNNRFEALRTNDESKLNSTLQNIRFIKNRSTKRKPVFENFSANKNKRWDFAASSLTSDLISGTSPQNDQNGRRDNTVNTDKLISETQKATMSKLLDKEDCYSVLKRGEFSMPLYYIATRDSFAFDLIEKISTCNWNGRSFTRTEYFFDPENHPMNFKNFVCAFPDYRVGTTLYTGFFTHQELIEIEDSCYQTEIKSFQRHYFPMTAQMTCTASKIRRTKFFFGSRYIWTRQQLSEPHSFVGAGVRQDVSEPPSWMKRQVVGPLENAGIIPKGFINSLALNVYHDGKEGLAQHFDDATRFMQPIFTFKLFSDARLSFGSQLYGFCNSAFVIPMPRGSILKLEENSYAANGIKHCVRPCDMAGKNATMILRQMHHRVVAEATVYDEMVDLPMWISTASPKEDTVSYGDQKQIEADYRLQQCINR